MTSILSSMLEHLLSTEPRPGLHPIPGSKPLTVLAASLPPLLYYVALLLLAPPPPPTKQFLAVKSLRSVVALVAAFLFFRLPLAFHVPQSIGLTYQLGLVGIYGGCRVVDAFFISRHIPRRVRYDFQDRSEETTRKSPQAKEWSSGGVGDPLLAPDDSNGHLTSHPVSDDEDSGPEEPGKLTRRRSTIQMAGDFISRTMGGPDPRPVYETAKTEEKYPAGLAERAAWALELELSMRGIGFTWATADVRHTRKTWLPTVQNRLHSIFLHAVPVVVVSWAIIRTTYVRHFQRYEDMPWEQRPLDLFDRELPYYEQVLLTAALGAFLMVAFSLGHSMFAIVLHPLAPSPLAFFPPLYTTPVWKATSVRRFWSYCWHRLFARLFLVYGVWPGEWLERRLTGKTDNQSADVGKVLGAFLSSAFVHSLSVRGVLAGQWSIAGGEATFFTLNAIAIILEGAVMRSVQWIRKDNKQQASMWYDGWVGRIWWISVLLWTGRNFARGWVTSGLVREMAFM